MLRINRRAVVTLALLSLICAAAATFVCVWALRLTSIWVALPISLAAGPPLILLARGAASVAGKHHARPVREVSETRHPPMVRRLVPLGLVLIGLGLLVAQAHTLNPFGVWMLAGIFVLACACGYAGWQIASRRTIGRAVLLSMGAFMLGMGGEFLASATDKAACQDRLHSGVGDLLATLRQVTREELDQAVPLSIEAAAVQRYFGGTRPAPLGWQRGNLYLPEPGDRFAATIELSRKAHAAAFWVHPSGMVERLSSSPDGPLPSQTFAFPKAGAHFAVDEPGLQAIVLVAATSSAVFDAIEEDMASAAAPLASDERGAWQTRGQIWEPMSGDRGEVADGFTPPRLTALLEIVNARIDASGSLVFAAAFHTTDQENP